MKVPDLKALRAKLDAAAKKVQAAEELIAQKEKAVEEADGDKAKAEATEDAKLAEGKLKEAAVEFDATVEEVEAAKVVADKRTREKAVSDELDKIMQPDAVDTARVSGKGMLVESKTDPLYAEAHDLIARERAHYEAFAAFLADEEDKLDDTKREMIQGKSLDIRRTKPNGAPRERKDWNREAVLPKSISAMFLGAQIGYDMLKGKVVLSIDNAITNPSLAHNLVPQEFRATLLQMPMPPANIVTQVTRLPTNTGELTIPQLVQTDGSEFGGVAFDWVDEAETKPETEPQFTQVTITCHELAGYTELSHKILIRSAIALEPLLSSLYRAGISDELENMILNGSGTGRPLGILNTTGVHLVNRAAAGTVGYQDLVDLKYEVQFYHRQGARWCMGDDVEQDLVGDVDADGRPLYSNSIASGPYDRLLGYPFDVSYRSPALGSSGDLIWGNWKYYYLVVEEDVTIAKSDHFRFRSNRRAIKVFINVGGRAVQPRAFAYLGPVTGS